MLLSGKLGLKKNEADQFDNYLKEYYQKYKFRQRLCCCKKKPKKLNNLTKSQIMENLEKEELWEDACNNILDRFQDIKHLIQLSQDVELLKRVIFKERHLIQSPIQTLEYEKNAQQNQKTNTILTTMHDSNVDERVLEMNKPKKISLSKNKVGPLNIKFHPSGNTLKTDHTHIVLTTDRQHLNQPELQISEAPNTKNNFSSNKNIQNRFSNNALLNSNFESEDFNYKQYNENYKNQFNREESKNHTERYNFFENNCKIEALEAYLVALEKQVLLEKNLRKNVEEKFRKIEKVFEDIPISNCTKINDKNFLFLYKLITKDNPIISKNCSDIRKIEWQNDSVLNLKLELQKAYDELCLKTHELDILLRFEKNKSENLDKRLKFFEKRKKNPDSEWLIDSYYKEKYQQNTEDYETEIYQNIERGNFPDCAHYKFAIDKSLNELINKPQDEKSEIEKNLDKIFLKFIPKHLIDGNNVSKNIGKFVFYLLW